MRKEQKPVEKSHSFKIHPEFNFAAAEGTPIHFHRPQHKKLTRKVTRRRLKEIDVRWRRWRSYLGRQQSPPSSHYHNLNAALWERWTEILHCLSTETHTFYGFGFQGEYSHEEGVSKYIHAVTSKLIRGRSCYLLRPKSTGCMGSFYGDPGYAVECVW